MVLICLCTYIQGCELSNCTYQHPIYNEDGAMPFFDSSHVVESKGTGLVHTAPAHGFDDFLVCLAKNIPIVSTSNLDNPIVCKTK